MPEARVGDRLDWADFQPTLHGQPGLRMGLSWPMSRTLSATTSGSLGGSSFRFVGPGAIGKLRDVRWDVRVGLDRRSIVGDGAVLLWTGTSFEYGESRSWINSALVREEGPRNYLIGCSIAAGGAVRVSSRVDLRCQLGLSVLWGRASGVVTPNEYRWLSDDLGMGLGLAYSVR